MLGCALQLREDRELVPRALGVGVRDLMDELRRDDVAQPVKEWTVAADEVVQFIKCKDDVEKLRATMSAPPSIEEEARLMYLDMSCSYR